MCPAVFPRFLNLLVWGGPPSPPPFDFFVKRRKNRHLAAEVYAQLSSYPHPLLCPGVDLGDEGVGKNM